MSKERLESIETKRKLLITLADDVGTGEANLLTIANDMAYLIRRVQGSKTGCIL